VLARAADVRASEDVDDDLAAGRVGSRHKARLRVWEERDWLIL
jgi:hypothetical protein